VLQAGRQSQIVVPGKVRMAAVYAGIENRPNDAVAVRPEARSGLVGFDSEDGAVRYGKLLTFMAHLVGLFVGSGLFTVMSGGDDNILHV
jgi:hypothetical protein